MTKSSLKYIFIFVIIATLCAEAFADIRVRFARGRSSATVSGKVRTGGRVCYIAGARRGQTLMATVSSNTGKVMIFESGETAYQLEVEMSGDQSVCVDNIGRSANYSLTVSIR